MDFSVELQKLLDLEEFPPVDPLTELARAQAGLLENIQKNNSALSLQIEEIYDIIKESDENAKEVKAAAKREQLLLVGLIGMADLLDSLLPHMQQQHSQIIVAKMDGAMNSCSLERLGFQGERFEPRLHTVASAEYSDAPLETIIGVLESGYAYHGKIIRKATVILSKGAQDV